MEQFVSFYICVVDKGGKSSTCPDMKHHSKQSHLIKANRRLLNEEVFELLQAMSKTRWCPKVVGVWQDVNSGYDIDNILNYDDLNLTS